MSRISWKYFEEARRQISRITDYETAGHAVADQTIGLMFGSARADGTFWVDQKHCFSLSDRVTEGNYLLFCEVRNDNRPGKPPFVIQRIIGHGSLSVDPRRLQATMSSVLSGVNGSGRQEPGHFTDDMGGGTEAWPAVDRNSNAHAAAPAKDQVYTTGSAHSSTERQNVLEGHMYGRIPEPYASRSNENDFTSHLPVNKIVHSNSENRGTVADRSNVQREDWKNSNDNEHMWNTTHSHNPYGQAGHAREENSYAPGATRRTGRIALNDPGGFPNSDGTSDFFSMRS